MKLSLITQKSAFPSQPSHDQYVFNTSPGLSCVTEMHGQVFLWIRLSLRAQILFYSIASNAWWSKAGKYDCVCAHLHRFIPCTFSPGWPTLPNITLKSGFQEEVVFYFSAQCTTISFSTYRTSGICVANCCVCS